MSGQTQPYDTKTWLHEQWTNPRDIFSILLIVGGDVVRIAIAQICAGPVPALTPVVFSFGWVSYATMAVVASIGDNRLLPKPEVDCILINTKTGYKRANWSWTLSRILRDFDFWKGKHCDQIERDKLQELLYLNRRKTRSEPPENIRIGLRVTVWRCSGKAGLAVGDSIYWAGLLVMIVQLGIASIPWAIYGEWLTFMVTASGNLLALASGSLPQWRMEKLGVRKQSSEKRTIKNIWLTRGNGDHEALLILGEDGALDLEALASSHREMKTRTSLFTRISTFLLAALWVALLISITGHDQHTWFILGVGFIGMLHNIVVAGKSRFPKGNGIDLEYVETIVERKVMAVLWKVEELYPQAGASLMAEFFPGKTTPRESRLWQYARDRAARFEIDQKAYEDDSSMPKALLWDMPPLMPDNGSRDEVSDIPIYGPFWNARHV